MKYLYLTLILFAVVGCTSTPEDSTPANSTGEEPEVEMTPEQFIVRHLESKLSIPATEKYSYKIYREDLNGDDSLDYVVTVNLLERAINEAIESGRVAKRAEIGYIGNFNYIFYMDGAKQSISEAIPVPSSPQAELRVTFDHIRSEAYKDLMVDFRIRNACYRRFFTVLRELPRQTFETKIFDGLGTPEREAYTIRYEPGSYSLAKDIVVYKAELEDLEIDDPNAVYTIDPEITETDIMDRRWFFNGHELKYYTEKD